MAQSNIRSLNKTIRCLDLDDDDRSAATIELARTLARQMDDALPEPSTRLSAAYLSVLKDLTKAGEGAAQESRKTVRCFGYGGKEKEMDEFMKRFG
mgnify:CR=1 FL=1